MLIDNGCVNNGFIEISSPESLNEFLADVGGAAVLFKHSETCGVSSRAYGEMAKLKAPVGLVTVQKARAVSNEIESRWSVTHETPQVLIIRDGKLLWDASHFQIRAATVEAALLQVTDGR
jgi:bacillithiol system protein YtxJ